MGFRVGKRFGNTYISTNGKNIRTTTKVGKNFYYTHQYGHSKKRNVNNNDNMVAAKILFDVIYFIFLWVFGDTLSFGWLWFIVAIEGGLLGMSIKLKLMGIGGNYTIIKHIIIIIYLYSII